jgi:flavodoxin I
MSKVLVIYYSRTGNTEKMAEAVVEGAKSTEGAVVELQVDSDVSPKNLADFDAIAVGVPTYHHDMTIRIKNLFEETAVKNINLGKKAGAAFGSYGWSGEAPRLVLEIMKNKFGMNVIEPPLLAKYAPDSAMLEKCLAFGATIANKNSQ